MKRRMWILYGALFACGLLLQSCNKAETTQIPAENQEPIKLKVAVFRFLSYGPFFIAQDEGFFAEQGLDVEFVHFEKTADSIPALARGDLDVATGILTVNLLNAIASGENIRFTASRGYMEVSDCPYGALMAQSSLLEDGSLVDPVQLKDMRIAMDVPSIYQYLLDQHLAQASLDSGDVNAQTISFPTMSESFANDAIDLGFTFEPWVTRIKKSGNGDVYIPLADIEPGFPVGFILYGNNLLNNTEAGRRFMVAYLKAVAQYNEGKTDHNVEIVATNTDLEPDFVREACWLPHHSDGVIAWDAVLNFQDWAVANGYLDAAVSREDLEDASFIEYANDYINAGN